MMVLLLLAGAAAWMVMRWHPAPPAAPHTADGLRPSITARANGAGVVIRSTGGGEVLWSCAADAPLIASGTDRVELPWYTDTWATERMVSIPTAMQWYHPWPFQPSAMLVRAAERDAAGRTGP